MRLSKFINKTFLKKTGTDAEIVDTKYTIQNINTRDGVNVKRDELKVGDIIYAAISTTIKENGKKKRLNLRKDIYQLKDSYGRFTFIDYLGNEYKTSLTAIKIINCLSAKQKEAEINDLLDKHEKELIEAERLKYLEESKRLGFKFTDLEPEDKLRRTIDAGIKNIWMVGPAGCGKSTMCSLFIGEALRSYCIAHKHKRVVNSNRAVAVNIADNGGFGFENRVNNRVLRNGDYLIRDKLSVDEPTHKYHALMGRNGYFADFQAEADTDRGIKQRFSRVIVNHRQIARARSVNRRKNHGPGNRYGFFGYYASVVIPACELHSFVNGRRGKIADSQHRAVLNLLHGHKKAVSYGIIESHGKSLFPQYRRDDHILVYDNGSRLHALPIYSVYVRG